MGKLRRQQSSAPKREGKFQNKGRFQKLAASDDEMSDDVDPNSREFIYDEIDDYHDEQDKMLLGKGKKMGWSNDSSDEEAAVFGLESSDEDDKPRTQKRKDDDDMASDIDDIEEEGLPDLQAWGKKRKDFHSTDFVDQDFSGLTAEETEAADLEEKEAKRIQKKLTEQLDEADFGLDFFPPQEKVSSTVQETTAEEEIIKADLSQLSKREKLELLKKDSPEFFGLVDEFKEKMAELRDKLHPIIKEIQAGNLPASTGVDYVKTKYHLILNYCTNLAFYLLLKAKRIPVRAHPVIKRLFQFKKLLEQLAPADAQMEAELQSLLQNISEGSVPLFGTNSSKPEKSKKKKHLKVLSTEELEEQRGEEEPQPKKKQQKELYVDVDEGMEDIDDFDESQEHQDEEDRTAPEEGKRAITYEMSKNKGLMPHRKKEQRNPRVKHRMKYRKAKIRRKGQVREPRKELTRYGGEMSGIKIGVSKSIKFKH